jgi:hypothetical protein
MTCLYLYCFIRFCTFFNQARFIDTSISLVGNFVGKSECLVVNKFEFWMVGFDG